MEGFVEAAANMHIVSTFVVGAAFGLFLCIGTAWSSFLQALATLLMPSDDGGWVVMRELLFACITTFLCILLLISLIQAQKCIRRVERRRPLPRWPVRPVRPARKLPTKKGGTING